MASISSGSALLLSSRLLSSIASFVAVLGLAHTLGPAGRGTMAFIAMAGLLLAGLSYAGTVEAAIVFASRWPAKRPRLLANLLLFTVATTAVVACGAVAVLVASGVKPAGLGGMEAALIPVGAVGIAASASANAYLLGTHRFLQQAIGSALPSVLFCGLVTGAWATVGVDLRLAVELWAGAQLAAGMAGSALAIRVAGIGRPDRALFRQTVGFGARAWVTTSAWYLNARADQVIMGFLATDAMLGVYAVAVNASELPLHIPSAVSQVLLPTVAASSVEERRETTMRVLRVLHLVAIGMLLVGLACAPLVPIVFGSAFEKSLVPYLVLLPGVIPYTMMVVFAGALIAASRPGRASLGLLVALVVGLSLDFALIPGHGAMGAAIAATAAFAAGGPAMALLYRQVDRISLSELLPRAADLAQLWALVRRLRNLGRRSRDGTQLQGGEEHSG